MFLCFYYKVEKGNRKVRTLLWDSYLKVRNAKLWTFSEVRFPLSLSLVQSGTVKVVY